MRGEYWRVIKFAFVWGAAAAAGSVVASRLISRGVELAFSKKEAEPQEEGKSEEQSPSPPKISEDD